MRRQRFEYRETQYAPCTTRAVFVGDDLAVLEPCAICGRGMTSHGRDDRRPPMTCPPPYPLSPRVLGDSRPDAELLE